MKTLLVISGIIVFFSCMKKNDGSYQKKSFAEVLKAKKDTSHVNIYVIQGNHGKDFNDFLKKNNLQEMHYIDDKMIIGEGYSIDYKKLDFHLNETFPDPNATGICYIDIEDPYINALSEANPDSKEFKRSLDLFVNSIKYCKSKRPNVQWGHYGMPRTTFEDPKILSSNKYLGPIYEASDVLFPSLYLFKDDQAVDYQVNFDYLNENTIEAIKIGKQYKKPVIGFVMHRFHNSDKRLQFLAMSDEFWARYLNSVLKIKYGNKRLDGITWWGADTYFYTSKAEGSNLRKEFSGNLEEFKKFNDQKLIHKGNILINTVDNRKK
ncbi:hypothetical protein JET18_03245 [Chryseobacterium sp. L7]|uniref:GH26 domain-containing protein n=1 Tax=Chryseobacterium endalhagicum TaxID=2797638 RepID=A0ABS1QB47_9FLAO|nr:hypothetical protein [Chryseobacterium endalhagicum]MBL1219835.1 hypothetical protein [Chryseobacterium endalhagicum]